MLFFFCFFKQKTAYEMRISDWSSDVCSSDLGLHDSPSCESYASPAGQSYLRDPLQRPSAPLERRRGRQPTSHGGEALGSDLEDGAWPMSAGPGDRKSVV